MYSISVVVACMGLVRGLHTCRVYDEYLDYVNITELGVAALENNADAVDNLVKIGCDVNYNGTGIRLLNMKYVDEDQEFKGYEYNENYEEYEYDENDFTIVYGETALNIAIHEGSLEVVRKLVDTPGLDLDAKSGGGETALHNAASYGLTDIIEILDEAGANLESVNTEGFTPLQTAAMYGEVESVRVLSKMGALIDRVGGMGMATPLIMAVQMGFMDVVQLLIEMGVNQDIKDEAGKTARDWALKLDDKDMLLELDNTINNTV